MNHQYLDLQFVPLGGSGEIGMNLNLYRCRDTWIMIDCGMMISSDETTDQILIPDITALRGIQISGIVLTHAHEDHIGAVADLWSEIRAPLYMTPFTAAVMRRKLGESSLSERVPFKIIPSGGTCNIGPFAIEFVPITHSTIESQMIILRTPEGIIVHTGDWKLDPDPVLGSVTQEQAIRQVGTEGVLAVVGDSTNAQEDGWSGSERSVQTTLKKLVSLEKGRVVCACFSSNIARLSSFIQIAQETGRNPLLLGRSLRRMVSAAQEIGYLSRDIPFVSPKDAMYIPRDRLLVICTGSQGETNAALTRISSGNHPDLILEPKDAVFFSSKVIPGNEEVIERLQTKLRSLGIKVTTEFDEQIHVSGHPCIEELKQMYTWLQPQVLIPVHGYPPHLSAHALVGEECGIPTVIEVRNGDLVTFTESGGAEILDQLHTGRRVRPPEVLKHRRGKRGGRAKEQRTRKSSSQRRAAKQVDETVARRKKFMDQFKR